MADKNYLDSDGVLYLWQKIKAKITDAVKNKVDKVNGKGLSTNDYTTAEKTKLAGIVDGANKYVHPTSSGNKHIPSGGSSGQILRWGADGTAVWGSDNNTTYADATQSTHGLMSTIDKKKLDAYPTYSSIQIHMLQNQKSQTCTSIAVLPHLQTNCRQQDNVLAMFITSKLLVHTAVLV